MAIVTRDQFLESKGVQRKIFQKGTFLADADLNEQAQVLELIDRQTLAAMVGGVSRRINGFAVSYDTVDEIDVSAGTAVICRVSDEAVILRQEAATTIDTSGLSDGSGRVLYIDIHEREVDVTSDSDIVNPDIGEETCVDMRLTFSLAVANSVQTPGTGHFFITLATFTISSGVVSNISHSIANHIYSNGKDFIVDGFIECDSSNGIVLKDNVELDGTSVLQNSVGEHSSFNPVGGTVNVTARIMKVSPTASTSVTGTPNVQTTGINAGQMVTIINIDGTYTLNLNDETSVSGSGLRLISVSGDDSPYNILSQYDSITLVFDGSVWIEVSRSQRARIT